MRRGLVCLALLAATGACADLAGLGDLPDLDAEIAPDGGADVVVANDGGGTDGGGSEGGADVAPADAALEACDDGGVCVDVPTGYTVVEYDPTDLTSCTTGYGNPQDMIENPKAQANSCNCTNCQTTPTVQPTCSCGANPVSFDVTSYTDAFCVLGATATQLHASSACYMQSQSLPSNTRSVRAKPTVPCTASGGSCKQSNPSSNFTTTHTTTRRCDLSGAVAACGSGGSCVPSPGAGLALCVTDGTLKTCPAAFSVSHVVGTSVVDTRTCSCTTCSLTNAGSCTTTLTLYTSNSCGAGSDQVTADNSCNNMKDSNFSSADYTTTESGASCGGGGSPVIDGGVSLGGSYRICCAP